MRSDVIYILVNCHACDFLSSHLVSENIKFLLSVDIVLLVMFFLMLFVYKMYFSVSLIISVTGEIKNRKVFGKNHLNRRFLVL